MNSQQRPIPQDYARNVYSQYGEDGMLEFILDKIGVNKGTCCEFGAWDGRHLSNTFYLLEKKGWSGLLIEGSSKRYQDLLKNTTGLPSVNAVNAFVGLDGENCLDEILLRHQVPVDFDLLSIDIDGCDYHVWESLKKFSPKIVVIEFNPSMSNRIKFVQPRDMKVQQGSSIRSIVDLAHSKGYELVATTDTNGIFVKEEFFNKIGVKNNSLDQLRDDSKWTTEVYGLYDGTMCVTGTLNLRWHMIAVSPKRLQILPRCMRFFPDDAPFYARVYYSILRIPGKTRAAAAMLKVLLFRVLSRLLKK